MMNMITLGISCYYHDAAACIVRDGKVIAAAEEERFTRKKHDYQFPKNAIMFCLEQARVTGRKLDTVSFYERSDMRLQRIMAQHLQMAPFSFNTFQKSFPKWLTKNAHIEKTIREFLNFNGPIDFPEHHVSHAASCFFASPFKKAAILTIDGVGEWATTAISKGEKNSVAVQKEIPFPHSLGLLYSTITAYLGFKVNNAEYKVMGLSAYGNPKQEYENMKRLITQYDDGSFRLDLSYFDFYYKAHMPGKKLITLFGQPVRKPGEPVTQFHKNVAAALQKVTEETLFGLVKESCEITGEKNLCMAGGVALNSVANGKLLAHTPAKKIYIQPAAGDSGASLGAAYYSQYHAQPKLPRRTLTHAYLGPEFTDAYLRGFLDTHGITYQHMPKEKDLIKTTAELILQNNVVGWFQGRMEFGPRALGARSILSNPCNPDMKNILNARVKHREQFRPFAPVVCADDAATYFECDEPLPRATDFMLMVYPIREQWRQSLPGVTHVDGSGRLQTIRREQNPLYYSLIKKFGKLSGTPMLINTSFNIRGEPIVCTPKDAYYCLMGTEIDWLVMGHFFIRRSDNPDDVWKSSANSND